MLIDFLDSKNFALLRSVLFIQQNEQLGHICIIAIKN